MTTRHARIATTALIALGVVSSSLWLKPLGLEKLRTGTAASGARVVPVELVLLVDTSGSVDADEYRLQRSGYEEAFRSQELIELIDRQGGIAVSYIEWSDVDHQDIRIGWTLLNDRTDCYNFASQIGLLDRRVEGSTRMAPAVQFAAEQIATNEYIGLKRVIDVSGDGRGQNYDYYLENSDYSSEHGTPWNDVVVEIAGKIDVVNGICITAEESVVDFYRDILPQGDDSFMMQVATFDQFDDAIVQKLIREIGTIPGMYD